MTTKAEVQDLLRFLSQDSKIPLATAMGKIKALQEANLISPEAIASNSITKLEPIFTDDPKHPKAILAAAKRVSKKRSSSQATNSPTTPTKRLKPSDPTSPALSGSALESSLALPILTARPSLTSLQDIALLTNRAPLCLAFALTSLAYTHPRQPLSSRLSLAQALVSANSSSKAVSIGLKSRSEVRQAEDVGLGLRQVKVLGRELGCVRRVEGMGTGEQQDGPGDETEPALWGVDVEALARPGGGASSTGGLPIHAPQGARNYLLRSFASARADGKKTAPKLVAQEKEENLARLMFVLELVFESWMRTDEEGGFYGLGKDELDRRAWGWYVKVRPDVRDGAGGWGEKNSVRLGDILDLRRKAGEDVEVKPEKQEADAEGVSQATTATLKDEE